MDFPNLTPYFEACESTRQAGENLEYSPAFLEMIRLSEIQPELQFGATIVEAREPDWHLLLTSCLELAHQTRDLRVGVRLVESLCHLHHWEGLAQGLEVLSHWVIHYWESVHPQLDSDDQCDVTFRISILSHLNSLEQLARTVQSNPLIEHRTHGVYSLRDHRAQQTASSQPLRISQSDVATILREADRPNLVHQHAFVLRSIKAYKALVHFLSMRLEHPPWIEDRLLEMLVQADQFFQKQIANTPACDSLTKTKNANHPLSDSLTRAEFVAIESEIESESKVVPSLKCPSFQKVTTRGEASAAIDSICAYFEVHEPASPVPLLLQRAKRLIPMSFVEIIRELASNEAEQLLQSLSSSGRAA